MSDILQLLGGPRDGDLVTSLRRIPPWDYRIPIPLDWGQILLAGPDHDVTHPELPVGIYRPDRDESGFIHRNDAGQLLYLWRGIRNA